MKRVLLIFIFSDLLRLAFAQDIHATWFFDQDSFIRIEENKASSEPFDFIIGCRTTSDTLIFNHRSGAIPDSRFLIVKLEPDSLILVPVNNSAKAIAAWFTCLACRPIEDIEKNPEAVVVSYLKVVKLYNAATLYESIKWDTLTLSNTSAGWWGTRYFDIKIASDGHVFAVNRYVPYEEGRPSADQITRTAFYEDKLPDDFLKMMGVELNNSGVRRMKKISDIGGSSHGRRVAFKLGMAKETKVLTSEDRCFPYKLHSLVNAI